MTEGVIRSSNLTSCELQAIASNLDSPQWLRTEAFISSGEKKSVGKLQLRTQEMEVPQISEAPAMERNAGYDQVSIRLSVPGLQQMPNPNE